MYKMIKLEVGEDFYYSGQLWEIEDIKIKSEKQNSGIIELKLKKHGDDPGY